MGADGVFPGLGGADKQPGHQLQVAVLVHPAQPADRGAGRPGHAPGGAGGASATERIRNQLQAPGVTDNPRALPHQPAQPGP